jgi:SWI/SNF-related matrix-associated actin-dependent regulator of chromatin subfamily A protein 2/4
LYVQKKKKKKGEGEGDGGAGGDGRGGEGDENSQMSDVHVVVVESSTGRQLRGEEAPLASQLGAWLEAHPGWEALEDSDDEDEDSDEEDDDEDRLSKGTHLYILINLFLRKL